MRSAALRRVVRAMALAVIALAAGWVVFALLNFVEGQKDPADFFDNVPRELQKLFRWEFRPLSLLMFGGMLYVVPALSFHRRFAAAARQRFDFESEFGHLVLRESIVRWLLRLTLGIVCMLVGLVSGLLAKSATDHFVTYNKAQSLIYVLPLTALSGLLILTSWRLFARRADSVLRGARNAPILYLRSFAKDVRLLGGVGDFFRLIFFGAAISESYERALARSVADLGPLVAVGQPHERLPPLGAARLYVRDDWQDVVSRLVARSQLVILRIGQTDGFWWEVQHLIATCDPRKVLIYLPKKDRKRVYDRFRERAADVFPYELPYGVDRAMFLGFGEDWTPRPMGRQGPSAGAWLRKFLGGSGAIVREALNGALPPLGIRPRPLPWRFMEIVALILWCNVLMQCCCGIPMSLMKLQHQREAERRFYDERYR